jgi:hypothetical protein
LIVTRIKRTLTFPRGLLLLLVATAMLAILAYGPTYAAPPAGPGAILLYTGDGAVNEGYTDFGAAAGRTIDTQAVLPANLDSYACIVLPINSTGFSVATKDDLSAYLNGGGRILALSEHEGFSPGSIATMNDLATHVGADLQVQGAILDSGFQVTANIDSSPLNLTDGVNTIRYAASSIVQVVAGPDAHSLVRTRDGGDAPGTIFIAAQQIGGGIFVLSGDSNPFSDVNGGGYVTEDNDVLVFNLCGLRPEIDVPVDVRPTSCPNPLNVRTQGVLPVAILGTADFDVTDLDPTTVMLEGVEPVRWGAPEDVATPFEPFTGKTEAMDCTTKGSDGHLDQVFFFDVQEIIAALGGAGALGDGDAVVLHLTGELTDGTIINGEDVVRIIKRGQ